MIDLQVFINLSKTTYPWTFLTTSTDSNYQRIRGLYQVYNSNIIDFTWYFEQSYFYSELVFIHHSRLKSKLNPRGEVI